MEGRVDTDDPEKTPGVLWVRGANVMLGYYKNPEATEAVMGADGWMNTGDICNIDADGYLYIRGRDKNMILGLRDRTYILKKSNKSSIICHMWLSP